MPAANSLADFSISAGTFQNDEAEARGGASGLPGTCMLAPTMVEGYVAGLVHRGCGKIAFYLKEIPEEGAPLSSEGVVTPDGVPVERESAIIAQG